MSPAHQHPIVCGVDQSPESRAAAFCAANLAARLDVPLHLTHVAGGAPDETLADALRSQRASFVVVGADRRSSLERAVLGSIWCKSTAEAPCPVVVVNQKATVSCQGPIVVGDDHRDHTDAAVFVAADLATRLGHQLLLTKVVEDVPEAVLVGSRAGAHADDVRRMTTGVEDSRSARAGRRFDTESLVRHGEPAAELERAAEEEAAGLIVVGSGGRGPSRAAVLGSVAGRLVELARRPVVIVPRGEPPDAR